MNQAYAFGQEAEKRATIYYRSLGFKVVAQNYRYCKADLLVAVEVKARSSNAFGVPHSFISPKKNYW